MRREEFATKERREHRGRDAMKWLKWLMGENLRTEIQLLRELDELRATNALLAVLVKDPPDAAGVAAVLAKARHEPWLKVMLNLIEADRRVCAEDARLAASDREMASAVGGEKALAHLAAGLVAAVKKAETAANS
jgi:hypothetical protein